MPNLNSAQHLEHDKKWFGRHNNPWRELQGERGTQLIIDTKTFYILPDLLELKSYKVAYGYYKDNNVAKARKWYYSQSEASWRAFNGYRDDGSWQKGSEAFSGHESGGYVFEAMVHKTLAIALDNLWEPVINSPDLATKTKSIRPINNDDPALDDYCYYGTCQLAEVYSKERIYRIGSIPKISSDIKDLKKGSVTIQREYDRRRIGIGHVLKKQTNLWDWITSCLDQQESEKVTQFHPILGVNFTTCTYLLRGYGQRQGGDCFIEISSTDARMTQKYIGYNQAKAHLKSIDTSIVWIKNVYYANARISSFGNYTEIPIHLAFIVQKPCDYVSQQSRYCKNKLRYNDQLRPALLDKENITFNEGTYLNNALINEAVSPLVKAFKVKNSIPRFTQKYPKDDPTAIQGMKELIILSVDEYTQNMREEDKNRIGYHGSYGLERAAQLKELMLDDNTATSDQITTILYNCFIKNKVGSFSGGFFSKIQTNPASLSTYVFKKVMGAYLEKTPLLMGWFKETYPSINSPNDCILRMVLYINRCEQIPDNYDYDESGYNLNCLFDNRTYNDFITKESANLLAHMK